MSNQADSFRAKGVRVAYVIGGMASEAIKRGVHAGKFKLVFITPELLILGKRWREMLTGDVYAKRLKAFVTHCIAKW